MNAKYINASAREWALDEQELEHVRTYFNDTAQTSADYDALTPYEQAAVNTALTLSRSDIDLDNFELHT